MDVACFDVIVGKSAITKYQSRQKVESLLISILPKVVPRKTSRVKLEVPVPQTDTGRRA